MQTKVIRSFIEKKVQVIVYKYSFYHKGKLEGPNIILPLLP